MKSRIAVYGVITAAIVYGSLLLSGKIRTPWEASRMTAARQAVERAVDACSLNNKLLFDQAVLDADQAIGKLSWQDQFIESTSLDNKLALIGCPR
ncbi:MAG: hypothetical protein ACRD3D_10575 [Terriglobia bacterium]